MKKSAKDKLQEKAQDIIVSTLKDKTQRKEVNVAKEDASKINDLHVQPEPVKAEAKSSSSSDSSAGVKLEFENYLIDEHTFKVDGKEYSVKKNGTGDPVPSNVADKIVEESHRRGTAAPKVQKVEE